MSKSCPVTKCDPFSASRCWGDEKYRLNNMLLRQYNFPEFIPDGDELHSEYADRVYDNWRQATQSVGFFRQDDGQSSLSNADFLRFCCMVVGYTGDKAVGCRIVRYTNVSSGYPCPRVDVYVCNGKQRPPLYSDSSRAPNLIRPQYSMEINGYLLLWD